MGMVSIPAMFKKVFPKRKRSTHGSYLAIFLMEKGGIVHVLQSLDGTLQSVHNERFTYTNGWEHIVEDIDDALYRLETGLGDVPDKAIFFVFSHIIDFTTHEIRRPYLQKIKELVKSLDLEALGYIEAREAVSEYVQNKKRMPPSMILLELDVNRATLFIYHNGHVSYHKEINTTEGIARSVNETLVEIKPTVAIPQDLFIYSYSDSDAEQLGSFRDDFNGDVFETQPHIEIITLKTLESSLISLFSGQVLGKKAPAVVYGDEEQAGAEDTMGFVIGDDVDADRRGSDTDKDMEAESESSEKPKKNIFAGLQSIRMPRIALSHTLLAGIGVLLIVISAGVLEYFFHKATVTVVMPAQSIKKTVELTDKDIQLNLATSSAQFTETKKATGSKTIGEKAKGSVTIYNSSLSGSKSFESGTTIKGPGGIAFVLDDDVTIASAEGDASDITASTKDSRVTASAIGTEYNLSGGNKFTVDNEPESEVIAKNADEFTGGSEKTVTIVSSADVESLKKTIAEKQKKEKSSGDSSGQGRIEVPQLSGVSLTDVKSTPAVSQEAEVVQLKATGITQSYYYDAGSLQSLLADKLKGETQEGFVIKPSEIEVSVRSAVKSKTSTKVALDITARATPTIELSRVAPAIIAKKNTSAERVLKDTFHARSADISVTHPLTMLNGWLPLRKENITVDIRFEEQ